MKNLFLAAAFCVSLSPLAAAGAADNDYFRTGLTRLTSEVTERDLTEADTVNVPMKPDNERVGPAAAIVNGGVQAWNVINSGKPDANLSSSYASAIPGFSFNWANFSGWKKREAVYTYTVTNLMQVDVIKIKFAVSYYYNGQNLVVQGKPGSDPISSMAQRDVIKGHYITNFTVRPLSMNIKWGWKFSLNVRMSDPMNIAAPGADPVAYLQSDLNYIVSTPFSTDGAVWTYGVDGLGGFRDLTAENRELAKQIPEITPLETKEIKWY
ncbi:MAG: hypothetical protein M0011_07125 [Elusimicrobia bacterium]|nr:hypothetical protein [Elusimicrobiota bacterium]